MTIETDTSDDCLCQGKVPEDKRIDFLELRPVIKNGQPVLVNGVEQKKWKPVLRFHKDCPTHGITVTEVAKCPAD